MLSVIHFYILTMAILNARCDVSSDHQAGLLGWSLFYQDVGSAFSPSDPSEPDTELESFLLNKVSTFNARLIAEGNDFGNRGICFLEVPSISAWPIGIYLIRVRRFHSVGLVPLSSGKENWILKAPREKISCGGYTDVRPAIALR